MKKYGKYEKRPEGVPVKQPKVKSVLLQTYLTSLLCMVLCVTMFFGTSYAWFTSEVENTGNEIYIGTLAVDLQDESGESLASSDKKLFDSNIRWEPGYTALETIKVVNEGDLAFRYVLNFTGGAAKDKENNNVDLASIAEHFDIWVYDHQANENSAPDPDSYADIVAENSGWKKVGTLTQVLNGEDVLKGTMESVRNKDTETAANEGTTDGVATQHTYTIALHMSEEATNTVDDSGNNSLMGKSISLNVKLVAYQMASENDGFDSSVYDDITAVTDVEGLKSALSAGGNVLLTSDVEIENAADLVTMSGGILDGNGKVMVYSGERNSSGGSVGVVTTSGGTVRNLTIKGENNGRALYITKLSSDLVVSNCTFSGAYAFNLNSADVTGHTMTFTNTTFASWSSYANVMEHAYFTDCKFENVLRPYGDTTLTNCEFTTEGLDVSELAEGETITLENCSYNGTIVGKVVLTVVNGEIQLECEEDLLAVSDEKTIVLSG